MNTAISSTAVMIYYIITLFLYHFKCFGSVVDVKKDMCAIPSSKICRNLQHEYAEQAKHVCINITFVRCIFNFSIKVPHFAINNLLGVKIVKSKREQLSPT